MFEFLGMTAIGGTAVTGYIVWKVIFSEVPGILKTVLGLVVGYTAYDHGVYDLAIELIGKLFQ